MLGRGSVGGDAARHAHRSSTDNAFVQKTCADIVEHYRPVLEAEGKQLEHIHSRTAAELNTEQKTCMHSAQTSRT